ncbi:MAG: hypothetical protein ACK4GU_02370 [Alishewanella aestuarii]
MLRFTVTAALLICLFLINTAYATSSPLTIYFKDANQQERQIEAQRKLDHAGRVTSVFFLMNVRCTDDICANPERDLNDYLIAFRDAVRRNDLYTKQFCDNRYEACDGNEIFSAPDRKQLVEDTDAALASKNKGPIDKWLDRLVALGTLHSFISNAQTAQDIRITVTTNEPAKITLVNRNGRLVGFGYLEGENFTSLFSSFHETQDKLNYTVYDVPEGRAYFVTSTILMYIRASGGGVTSVETKMECTGSGENKKCVVTGVVNKDT